jgi:hypothetical protein
VLAALRAYDEAELTIPPGVLKEQTYA